MALVDFLKHFMQIHTSSLNFMPVPFHLIQIYWFWRFEHEDHLYLLMTNSNVCILCFNHEGRWFILIPRRKLLLASLGRKTNSLNNLILWMFQKSYRNINWWHWYSIWSHDSVKYSYGSTHSMRNSRHNYSSFTRIQFAPVFIWSVPVIPVAHFSNID